MTTLTDEEIAEQGELNERAVDARDARLDEPHVRPLMELVRSLRARGYDVPNVDPNDGGVDARVLILLETPGPRAVGSRFVSRDNPDPSARNLGKVLDDAALARSTVLVWNVVPYCVSTIDQNRNVSAAQIREAITDCQAFVDRLHALMVVVFCGRSAQLALSLLHLPPHVRSLNTTPLHGPTINGNAATTTFTRRSWKPAA